MCHKHIQWIATMLLLGIFTFANAQKTSEEKAILDVINQDRQAWAERDFDKWESTWAKKPYTSTLWSSPATYMHTTSWEKIAENTKQFFKNNPNPVSRPDKIVDPVININGNMAVVRVSVDGNYEVRTLEKENGQWRHIQFCGVGTSIYDRQNMLNRLVGNWTLDKESVKVSENPGHLASANSHIKKEGTRVTMETKVWWNNGAGNLMEGIQNFLIVPNDEGGAAVTQSMTWLSGNAGLSTSMCEMEGGSKLSGKFTAVGEQTPWGKVTMDFSDDSRIKMAFQFMNEKGENTWDMKYDLVRAGM